MKILKIIGIIIVAIVALVLVAGLLAPKDFNVNRSITINASPETVFRNISTFEQFNKWNPWNKLDSNQVVTQEGTDGTVGAKRSWKGNSKVGEGSMTLTKAEPNKSAEYALDFLKPFKTHNIGYMDIETAEGGQKVTWGMKGSMPYPMNALLLVMNIDKEGGKDFEEGLASLKTLSESAPTSAYQIKEVDWTAKNCLSVRKVVGFVDMPKFFGTHYPKMAEAIGKGGAKPGIPLAVFYRYDEKAMNADVAAAIPYEGKKIISKEYAVLNLPATKANLIDYFGDYNGMKPAYDEMTVFLKKNFNRENPDMVVEEYVSDPMSEKDTAKWETKIYFFVKKEEVKK